MSAKHTPGPWVASQYLDNGQWGIITHDNQIVVGLSSRISEADARFIAAAPDLLESLRETLKALEHNFAQVHPDYDGTANAHSIIGRARAAIAKAEGGAA